MAAAAALCTTLMAITSHEALAADGMAGPVYDWGGAYLGVNAGFAFGTQTQQDNYEAGSGNQHISGGLIGAQLGASVQYGAAVLGVETDLQYAPISGSFHSSDRWDCGDSNDCETDVSWFGTSRARVGYALGRFLPYVTGGLAYGTVNSKADAGWNWNLTDTVLGWTAGGGFDVALTDALSARAEYLYVDLGDTQQFGEFDFSASTHFNVLRAGLNYRF